MSPFVEPYIPEPRRPFRQRTAGRALYWLERLFRSDVAIGPAEMMALIPIFAITGWLVGDAFGAVLRPLGKLPFQLGGAIIGLILVKPALGFRTPRGYLGIASAGLLAFLISCGAGSVGQFATLSRETVAAYQLEGGSTNIVAKGPARGCQISINEYNLGLLSEAEMRKQCGDSLAPLEEGESATQTQLRVAKPNPFLFVLAGMQFLVVVAILVFLFKKP